MTEHGETGHAYAQLQAKTEDMLEGMTEEERDAWHISFPFPDPSAAGTAADAQELRRQKEERRRRHPRRRGSLSKFIEIPEDSE